MAVSCIVIIMIISNRQSCDLGIIEALIALDMLVQLFLTPTQKHDIVTSQFALKMLAKIDASCHL